MTDRRQQPSRDARIPLVYILAASHSGSTLLALLLGMHPGLCTVGELKLTSLGDVDRYRCGCGATIPSCPFWTEVARRMQDRGIPFDLSTSPTDFVASANAVQRRLLAPLHRSARLEWLRDAALALTPGWRAHLTRVQRANAALGRTLLELTGRRALVDSSKVGLRLKYLLRNPAFDVRIIRFVRDGRAVALTYMDPAAFADARTPELRGGGHGGNREAERIPMPLAAREWRRANEEAGEIVRQLPPGRSVQARYEDLCANPDAVLSAIFTFIGVEPMTCAALAATQRAHHVVGNGMRLDWDGRILFDDRWRGVLGTAELAAFDSVAGALNRHLGYGDAA
jgi:hypothetical protein